MIEALKQDYPQRLKVVVGAAPGKAWSGATKLASRAKAAALLGFIYWVALPLSLFVLFLRTAVARVLGRRPAATNGANHEGQPADHGPGSKQRGTALVSGER